MLEIAFKTIKKTRIIKIENDGFYNPYTVNYQSDESNTEIM